MRKTVKVHFGMYLKTKNDKEYKSVCFQSYTLTRGEHRKIVFFGREYELSYYDCGEKKGVVVRDTEDQSTHVGFHNDVECREVVLTLDTWDNELLTISISEDD